MRTKKAYCPVNGWDCTYYKDGECGIDDPYEEYTDFQMFWEKDDDYYCDEEERKVFEGIYKMKIYKLVEEGSEKGYFKEIIDIIIFILENDIIDYINKIDKEDGFTLYFVAGMMHNYIIEEIKVIGKEDAKVKLMR